VSSPPRSVLVSGVTGYVGGRLVPRLLDAGYRVRVLARDPSRLADRPWLERVELAEGDVLRPETLPPAFEGIDAAYYLVHSLGGGGGYSERDALAARNFAAAAKRAGTARLLYLGGLGDPEADLSEHLRSRHRTGDALREAGVPVTEFRCAVVVGSGSASFEMLRYLTERLPVMICPRWVYTRIQPIAIRNVIDYLVAALDHAESAGKVLEIGGADVVTYGEMMTGYARVRGLRRLLLAVPVLTPRLSSYWVHLVTPIPAAIAQPLIEGLRNEVVVRDDTARRLFPEIELLDYQSAVRRAVERLGAGRAETAWHTAVGPVTGEPLTVVTEECEGMFREIRQRIVNAPPETVWREFMSLGGDRGWLFMDWAWQIRGFFDRIAGGPGMRRGRRDLLDLRVGDPLDFWRVEAIEKDRLLRLRAEMKVPGRAWLEYQSHSTEDGRTLLVQTAFFESKGLAGFLYWYLLYPPHAVIFSGLIRRIARGAERDWRPLRGLFG